MLIPMLMCGSVRGVSGFVHGVLMPPGVCPVALGIFYWGRLAYRFVRSSTGQIRLLLDASLVPHHVSPAHPPKIAYLAATISYTTLHAFPPVTAPQATTQNSSQCLA